MELFRKCRDKAKAWHHRHGQSVTNWKQLPVNDFEADDTWELLALVAQLLAFPCGGAEKAQPHVEVREQLQRFFSTQFPPPDDDRQQLAAAPPLSPEEAAKAIYVAAQADRLVKHAAERERQAARACKMVAEDEWREGEGARETEGEGAREVARREEMPTEVDDRVEQERLEEGQPRTPSTPSALEAGQLEALRKQRLFDWCSTEVQRAQSETRAANEGRARVANDGRVRAADGDSPDSALELRKRLEVQRRSLENRQEFDITEEDLKGAARRITARPGQEGEALNMVIDQLRCMDLAPTSSAVACGQGDRICHLESQPAGSLVRDPSANSILRFMLTNQYTMQTLEDALSRSEMSASGAPPCHTTNEMH